MPNIRPSKKTQVDRQTDRWLFSSIYIVDIGPKWRIQTSRYEWNILVTQIVSGYVNCLRISLNKEESVEGKDTIFKTAVS